MWIQLFVAVLVVMVIAMTDFSGYFLDEESTKLLYFDDTEVETVSKEQAESGQITAGPKDATTEHELESALEKEPGSVQATRTAKILSGQAAEMLAGQMPVVEPVVVSEPASDLELDLDSIAGNFIEEVSEDVGGSV